MKNRSRFCPNARVKISLEAVSQFAFSMAACLRSGMPPRKALALSGGTGSPRRLQEAARRAAEEVERGSPISDGLARSNQSFPHFVIPVIRAGEQSGRLAEAFDLIHEHGRRLQPTLKLVRNTWLYPLVCIVFGWVVRAGLLVSFGFNEAAWRFVRDLFLSLMPPVVITWLLIRTRWSRAILDLGFLQLPFLRETIIRFSVALFFATLRLGYDAGGLSVLGAFDLALDTVRNSAVRKDLLKARGVLEDHGTFGDAFAEPALLNDRIKGFIATGALSGHLGSSLDQIIRSETLDLENSLQKVNRVVQILITYGVAMSIVGTLLFVLMSRP